jgi:hypothetical protein
VETCVDRIILLIVKRRKHIDIPGFIGFLLWLDQIVGGRIGDRILRWKFPPV